MSYGFVRCLNTGTTSTPRDAKYQRSNTINKMMMEGPIVKSRFGPLNFMSG
jgi:hypothetical protein